MKSNYDPKNWYWLVGVDQTKVYSSQAGDYVPLTDPTFQAWSVDGTLPAKIDTEASLGALLSPYYPDVARPVAANVLAGYQQDQSDDIFRHKLIKLLFALLNRIQVLEGKSALTLVQARAYVKGLM